MKKLEVWPSESAFGVESQHSKSKVLKIRYASWCKLIFQISKLFEQGSLYSCSQESGGMGMWEKRNQGSYKNNKHRVRGNQTVWNNYYKGKQGQGLMETDVRLWPNYRSSGWGWMPGCPWVLILAPNTMGRDGCLSAPVGDWWGLISIQPRVIGVVWTVCDKMRQLWKMQRGVMNNWSAFRSCWGWLGDGLGGHRHDDKFESTRSDWD